MDGYLLESSKLRPGAGMGRAVLEFRSVRVTTDADGDVVARFEYGAWGELLSGSFDNVGLALRFVGALGVRTDIDTGLLYMRHRWYDAELQRFISRDPIGLRGGANLYGYCLNNPILYIDPTGRDVGDWNGIRVDGTARQIQDTNSALEVLRQTRSGGSMIRRVLKYKLVKRIVWKQSDTFRTHFDFETDTLYVDERDLCEERWYYDYRTRRKVRLTREQSGGWVILFAHEFGHASLETRDIDHPDYWSPNRFERGHFKEMETVIRAENPVRFELGLPIRAEYKGTPGGPTNSDANDVFHASMAEYWRFHLNQVKWP